MTALSPGAVVICDGTRWVVVGVFAGGALLTLRPVQQSAARRPATRTVMARHVSTERTAHHE